MHLNIDKITATLGGIIIFFNNDQHTFIQWRTITRLLYEYFTYLINEKADFNEEE